MFSNIQIKYRESGLDTRWFFYKNSFLETFFS